MQPLTLQQMFDTTLNALRQQGVQSTNGTHCVYRDANGNKCAVGHLIPDEMYDPRMESDPERPGEGLGVTKLCARFPQLALLFGVTATEASDPALVMLFAMDDPALNLLSAMQDAHDIHEPNSPRWEAAMVEIAANRNLVYTLNPQNS